MSEQSDGPDRALPADPCNAPDVQGVKGPGGNVAILDPLGAPQAFSLPLEFDPQAKAYLQEHGAETTDHCFHLANILHMNGNVAEASIIYRRAYDLHSKSPTQFPSAQALLQVRLLTLLKSGQSVPPDELQEMRSLSIPYAQYIEGVQKGWHGATAMDALKTIGNAFEEFHTGEEADTLWLEFALRASPSLFDVRLDVNSPATRIPRRIFMYWDKNPPPEIAENFEYHRKLNGFEVRIMDFAEATEWLYDNCGIEARDIFINARHPAEAADFLRLHLLQALGGWWLDADLKLGKQATLDFMATRTKSATFLLTRGHVVHNDFFGTCPNNEVLSDALLSIYRNCYLHPGLFIAYKTGPGVYARAINRIAYRSLNGNRPKQSIEIHDQAKFNELIEEFHTPYKFQTPNWRAI